MELSNEEVVLDSLIERTISEVHDAIPDVEIAIAGEMEHILGDEALLRQVLLNLIRNAAEAAGNQPFGGRVTVSGAVEMNAGRPVQRIAISDNGPGIPPSDLSKIFAPFYTTKVNGTGLGLAVVQKIVLQHGGLVEARNRPEGGAELIVWLPASRDRASKLDSVAAGT
jgi:signal transduction histidine kinase